MKKQMISFTEPQYEWLQAEATRLGIPVAELVRRIIDEHIREAVSLMPWNSMTTDERRAWDEMTDKLTALQRQVTLRFMQERKP